MLHLPSYLTSIREHLAREAWILPAFALTTFNYLVTEALRPFTGLKGHLDFTNDLTTIGVFVEIALSCLFLQVAWLWWQNRPLAEVRNYFSRERLIGLSALAILVNVNLTVLGQVKAQLDLAVPFSADGNLADLDRILFGGRDAWRVLQWAAHPYIAEAYHFLWLFWMVGVLCLVGMQLPSGRKSALLISYFALWTVGPIIHCFLPAAGPLFYDNLGLGPRFSELPVTQHTKLIENFLWEGYRQRTINFAGGISAMPSLHIATMAWAAIALFRTRFFPAAIIIAIYIFVGSIVTGWHYAIDGIAGALTAFGCYDGCRAGIKNLQRRGLSFQT